MIPCPECKKEVSDKANFCPSCGHPLAADTPKETPTTIQFTKKKWKEIMLWGGAVTLLGTAIALNGLYHLDAGTGSIGFLIGLAGFITLMVGRIGAWWSTG